MQDYLQKLVIVLPATAVAMGGLLLVVWIYTRRPHKDSGSLLPVPLHSVTTQVDESLQIDREIRVKLIEEAMESVKSILSENFRKKEATKISLEEFNNLYRKIDSAGDLDAKHMEPAIRIPGVASLAYEAAPQAVQRTDSFATLWVKELQKSGDGDDSNISNKTSERESSVLEELPTPPPQVIPTEKEPEPEITLELGLIEATDDHVQSPHELKLIQDLELYHILTSSSNLYRSMKALQATLNEHHADVPTSKLSDYECLERSAEMVLASVASTSTSCRTVAPHVLKGGAGAVRDFEWRLNIEQIQDVEESPPDTFVHRRPPSHPNHPLAARITDLDPELSYGWDGSEWKEKYGPFSGPSCINRRQKLQLASNAGIAGHYRSERVEARRKWDAVKNRYRGERGRTLLRPDLPIQSAEWRKRLRTLYSDSTSESGSDQPIRSRHAAEKQQGDSQGDHGIDDDPNRTESLLTSSSSSSGPESDESDFARVRKLLRNYSPRECKLEHRESPGADQGSSRLSSPSSEIE